MSTLVTLLAHSFKRIRVLVLTIATFLFVLQLVLNALAASLEESGELTQFAVLIPPFFRNLMGPGIAAFLSFDGIIGLGYFHPATIAAMVAMSIAVATQIAAEVETGMADLFLARPFARHWLIARSVVVSTGSVALAAVAMLAGSCAGIALFTTHPNVPWPMLTTLAGNLALVGLCWSGVALPIASVVRRRAVANGVSGLLAVATFLLDYVARLWAPARPYAPLSPFHFFSPMEIVFGTPPPTSHWWILACTAAGGFAVSQFLFSRRDISR